MLWVLQDRHWIHPVLFPADRQYMFHYKSGVRILICLTDNNSGICFEFYGLLCKDLVSPKNSSTDILKPQLNIWQSGGFVGHTMGQHHLIVHNHCTKASEHRRIQSRNPARLDSADSRIQVSASPWRFSSYFTAFSFSVLKTQQPGDWQVLNCLICLICLFVFPKVGSWMLQNTVRRGSVIEFENNVFFFLNS